MQSGEIIDIDGGWTSRNGRNKIHITQSAEKFEGYVGNSKECRITLGTISERTLNFKQTWHEGVNKGAVATVYGWLTSDGGTIFLEFEGMRANGRSMRGKNAIHRENIVGTWIPMGLSGRGDKWRFILEKNRQDITGYFHSSSNERYEIRGERMLKNLQCFNLHLKSSDGRREEVQGEYRCPNIILALPYRLGNRSVMLERNPPESFPKFEEYKPFPEVQVEESSGQTDEKVASFSSQKQPFRGKSERYSRRNITSDNQDDMRNPLLSCSIDVSRRRQICCCCCFVQ